ncbi:hypothetical protein [Escherichia coli]|uniref:hypothetical protein n=1 Tax=Escherichia coli TaxID=562 RepID=UPI000E0EB6B5|nr:hypothetical protein [Escherichia coli]
MKANVIRCYLPMRNVACVTIQNGKSGSWTRLSGRRFAGGRGARQQVREQMQRTEREWVVKMPEKEIELEKTLGGD